MTARTRKKEATIPVIDVDLDSHTPWSDALAPVVRDSSKLIDALNEQVDEVIGAAGRAVASRAISALHTVLGGSYSDEIADIASAAKVPQRTILMANLAYDLSNVGCSTFAAPTREGPLHARNLDWSFPRGLLKKHVIVMRMRNAPQGDYAVVGWPGLFGVLTGMAPGRFSITVNFVRNSDEAGPVKALWRAVNGSWPVAWVVRQAFDEAKDFKSAVRMLKQADLLAPVLFTVAGTRNDERVVIERGCDSWAIRKAPARAPVQVTNHYVSPEFEDENTDLDEMDTVERLSALEEMLAEDNVDSARQALRVLSAHDLLGEDTQHQVVMQPKTGQMTVHVPDGASVEVEL